MKGGIYTDQKCPICGCNFRNNYKNALVCPNHPEQQATRFRVYFRGTSKRFSSYKDAERELIGRRYKTDENTFDVRDYKRDNPLGFDTLALEWLRIKKTSGIKEKTYFALKDHIKKAIALWGNRNVKNIRLKDFQSFLAEYNHSSKSKHNYIQALKQFWKWLYDNQEIEKLPTFPKVKFSLAWRKTVTKEEQLKILDELKAIAPYKCWLGVKFLATYYNLRPKELRNIKEGHIDLKQGEILIPDPKEGAPKIVYLLSEDIEILKSLPQAIDPDLYFFRHKNGNRFGLNYFYKYWKRACKNVGVKGVDLYGGTRHSTARALRAYRSPEEIKLGSGHTTSKAFSRYFEVDGDYLRDIYSDTQGGKAMAKNRGQSFSPK